MCFLLAGDAAGAGTYKQTCQAINSLFQHCVRKCSQDLIKANPDRIGFENLGSFLQYLWGKTISIEAACRRRCMLLHEKLSEELILSEDRYMDGELMEGFHSKAMLHPALVLEGPPAFSVNHIKVYLSS